MASVKLKITCRIEEVPTLGGFLLASMQSSIADFTAYSPDYNSTFMTNANADLAAIEALINPKVLTAELKVITARIYANLSILQAKIDLLEGYINRASNLTIAKEDFGISEVRKMNHKGDVEGLVAAVNLLLTNVGNNITSLTLKGYSTAQNSAFVGLRDSFKNDNIAQNNKVNERNNKVIANYGKINLFWDKLVEIADAGKRIYKATAPNRLDDFTMSKLKARIRQERNNTRFKGLVTNNSLPLKNSSVEMKPIAGGRRRKTKTKLTGEFEIKSIEPGEYNVTVSHVGFSSIVQQVTIEVGVPLTVNFSLD